MSVTTQQTVWCDVCGNWDQITDTRAAVLRHLKRQGWKRTRQDGQVKDICPACLKKEPCPSE